MIRKAPVWSGAWPSAEPHAITQHTSVLRAWTQQNVADHGSPSQCLREAVGDGTLCGCTLECLGPLPPFSLWKGNSGFLFIWVTSELRVRSGRVSFARSPRFFLTLKHHMLPLAEVGYTHFAGDMGKVLSLLSPPCHSGQKEPSGPHSKPRVEPEPRATDSQTVGDLYHKPDHWL